MKSFSESYKEAGVDVTAGYKAVELMSADHSVHFTVTVSAEEVPDYMKKYL